MAACVGAAGLSAALRTVALGRIGEGMLTGRMLCRRCLISQSHVSNWLTGRRELSPANCDMVLSALRLSAAAVFAGELPPAPAVAPRVVLVEMPAPWDDRRRPLRRASSPGRLAAVIAWPVRPAPVRRGPAAVMRAVS